MRCYDKMRCQDPVFLEQKRARGRANAAKRRADPEYHEREKARGRAYAQKKRAQDPDAAKARRREWRKAKASDPAYLERKRAYARKRRERIRQDPEAYVAFRDYHAKHTRKNRTGFRPEEVESARLIQGGKCAICRVLLDVARCVKSRNHADKECADHDHRTGRPRGLLCNTCNTVLGRYENRLRPRGLVFPALDAYLASPPLDFHE
jgi:hypothetical protein